MNYQEAKDWQTILITKLNEGLFAPDEWRSVIGTMLKYGFISMAHGLRSRHDYYLKEWCRETTHESENR